MSTQIPKNLKYTQEHEWALVEGQVATIGITDFAQSALGDIVFVEFPEVGTTLKKGESFGVVESIKSVSDLYSPITGEIIERNSDIEGSPEKINTHPYESWFIKVRVTNTADLNDLMSSEKYQEFCQSSH